MAKMNRKCTIFLQALLVAVLAAPFAGCEEDVFEYNTAKLYAVDPALISHQEVAVWKTAVPSPAFLAALPDGRIAVAGGRQCVVLATNGVEQSRFAWQGSAATAIGVSPDGRIFVGAKDRVVVGGTTGNPPVVVQVTEWNSLSEKAHITGLAANSNQLWICDANERLVWRFDFEGRLLGQLPAPDAPRDQSFVVPSPTFPVVTRNDGFFWVANPGRHQLEHRAAADGHLVASWSKPGMKTPGLSGCCNPAYLALLPDGSLVTSEKKIARVKIYGVDGTFRSVVAPPSVLPGEEGRPIAVDAAGRVLVLDGAKIHVFAAKEKP
jgi:hypothetical protein